MLVLGGTGKTGQRVVKALLKEGRDVVVAARSKESAAELYGTTTRGLFVQVCMYVCMHFYVCIREAAAWRRARGKFFAPFGCRFSLVQLVLAGRRQTDGFDVSVAYVV